MSAADLELKQLNPFSDVDFTNLEKSPARNGPLNLMHPTASLAVLIYNFAGMPFQYQVELAWATALVLVSLVLIINIIGQSLSKPQAQ